jgi:hypothetical protein
LVAPVNSLRIALLGLSIVTATVSADEDIAGRELRFLPGPPTGSVPYHTKHITLRQASLRTGWVTHEQCHYHLDQVAALEVVFKPGHVRHLAITRADHIGKAWIENASVQLQQVGDDAVLCLSSDSHALRRDDGADTYTLTTGPYMRRFLDGYFPLRVTLTVDYPAAWRLEDIQPPELRLHTTTAAGHLQIDALFEGELSIDVHFAPNPVPDARLTR